MTELKKLDKTKLVEQELLKWHDYLEANGCSLLSLRFVAQKIAALFEQEAEANYVKLDKDQSFEADERWKDNYACIFTQQDMLKAGWRKVEMGENK